MVYGMVTYLEFKVVVREGWGTMSRICHSSTHRAWIGEAEIVGEEVEE